jgi:peptidoglycan/LPS O-acetylase OafA/YrhL
MPERRNASLDILRAAAILAVLACHTANNVLPAESTLRQMLGVGGRGVDLFFVLSGFLLGQQLFKEAARTGTVDVRRFWIRRWLRTLPAYYACLLALFAAYIAVGKAEKIDWRYLVFLQNYLPDAERPYFGITWSLCVEEHFYLVIAPAVWWATRSRSAVAVCIGLTVGLIVLHALEIYDPQDEQGYTKASQVWFSTCLVGVLLGWAKINRPVLWQALVQFSPYFSGIGLLMVLIAAENRTHWSLPDWHAGGWAAIAAWWVVLAHRGPFFTEKVNLLFFRFVAARAYSVYLVHEFVLTAVREKVVAAPLPKALMAVVLAFAAAEVLYRLVERPALRWRDRIAA